MRSVLFGAGVLLGSLSLQAADIQDLATIISLQESRLKAQDTTIDQLQGQLAALQANDTAMTTMLQALISDLQSQTAALKTSVSNLQSSTSNRDNSLQAQISDSSSRITSLTNSLVNNYYVRGSIDQLLARYVPTGTLNARLSNCFIQLGNSDNNHEWLERWGENATNGVWKNFKLVGTVDDNDRLWYRFQCP